MWRPYISQDFQSPNWSGDDREPQEPVEGGRGSVEAKDRENGILMGFLD